MSPSDEDDEDELDEAGDDVAVVSAGGESCVVVASLSNRLPRADDCAAVEAGRAFRWRGDGGRKCLLWVTVFVEGVRDKGGGTGPGVAPTRGVPGLLASTREMGLSFRMERDDGVLEAI